MITKFENAKTSFGITKIQIERNFVALKIVVDGFISLAVTLQKHFLHFEFPFPIFNVSHLLVI